MPKCCWSHTRGCSTKVLLPPTNHSLTQCFLTRLTSKAVNIVTGWLAGCLPAWLVGAIEGLREWERANVSSSYTCINRIVTIKAVNIVTRLACWCDWESDDFNRLNHDFGFGSCFAQTLSVGRKSRFGFSSRITLPTLPYCQYSRIELYLSVLDNVVCLTCMLECQSSGQKNCGVQMHSPNWVQAPLGFSS